MSAAAKADTSARLEEDSLLPPGANGEEVMLGSLQRTVNRFSRRLLRFNTSASAKRLSSPLPSTPSSMASTGSSYLQHKLSTVGGTEEVCSRVFFLFKPPLLLFVSPAPFVNP